MPSSVAVVTYPHMCRSALQIPPSEGQTLKSSASRSASGFCGFAPIPGTCPCSPEDRFRSQQTVTLLQCPAETRPAHGFRMSRSPFLFLRKDHHDTVQFPVLSSRLCLFKYPGLISHTRMLAPLYGVKSPFDPLLRFPRSREYGACIWPDWHQVSAPADGNAYPLSTMPQYLD
jgi:hypothetical protein